MLQKRPILIFLLLLLMITTAKALYTDGVTMPHKITQYNPNRTDVVAAGLNFDTKLTANVDGVPVSVRFPSEGESVKIIQVKTYVNDYSKEIKYEYNLDDKSVKVISKQGEAVYHKDSDCEMNYVLLDKMLGIIRAAYADIGLYFNPEINKLSIDKAEYANKIDPSYNISVNNSDNKVSILIEKEGESATFTYDFNNRLIIYPNDIQFASSYDWDVMNNQSMALVDDPYGGIAAASVGESARWFLSGLARHAPYPGKYIWSAVKIRDQLIELKKYANFVVTPMSRLPDPEITNVSWIDKANGLVRIDGKGAIPSKSPHIYINNVKIGDNVQVNGENWSVTNYGNRLNTGENKINAINRGTSNREVESGDITVYLGTGGKPDLILLSPRDRQVVWDEKISETIPVLKAVMIKGKTLSGASLMCYGKNINVFSDGSFEKEILLPINEGINNVFIDVHTNLEDIALEKKLSGVFEFTSNIKLVKYILRKGDFVFNGKAVGSDGFDIIPYEPNHTGVYTGNREVTEAVYAGGFSKPSVIIRDLKSSWDNDGFYYAVQVPKIINEEYRSMVAGIIKQQKGKFYELPIHSNKNDFNPEQGFTYSLKGGQYTPDNNKFYCSELAYWGWEKIGEEKGFDFGVELKDTMFPTRGYEDRENCSILPAFLNERCMEVRSFAN
jgi:hypothetical protein